MDEAQALEQLTAIEHHADGRTWWELAAKLSHQAEAYAVTNARQHPRKWAQLNTLKKFLVDMCPQFVEAHYQNGQPALFLVFSAGGKTHGKHSEPSSSTNRQENE